MSPQRLNYNNIITNFFDIFPLDNVPDNYLIRCIHNFSCFCIRKVLWSEVGKYADKSLGKRKIYALLSKIPTKKVFKVYHFFIRLSNKKKTRLVRTLTFPTPNEQYGYERKWYENSIKINFEGIEFYGMRYYDEYLSFKFGDYMKLPPKEKRKVHPVTKIELM